MRTMLIPIAAGILTAALFAQDLTPRATQPGGPVLIQNATVHPVSGPVIPRGSVLIEGGRIQRVAPEIRPPGGCTVLDATGLHVYPGMIGAVTQLGLTEIEAVRASRDFAEVGGITPEVRASVAVNPDSTLFPVTRANGVLCAGVFPTGGVISGRASVIQLEGWTHEDMTVVADAGLVVNWPAARSGRGRFGAADRDEADEGRESRAAVRRIEEFFDTAAGYARAKAADPALPTDIRLEAMRPFLPSPGVASARPVFIHADEYDQILSALAFAARQGIRTVIVGGRDAALLADVLKRQNVGVIVTGTFKMPRRTDSPYDDAFTLPARLEAAGVKWCLASGEETPHERNLPYGAGLASAYGLSREAALRAVTLSAAELLMVDGEIGSLDPGKRATLIVTDGDPLEVRTAIRHAFIDGRAIDLSSKHVKLAERYRAKYR